jgi:ATP-dependent Clp protease ATP-binding subunit ClpC
VVVFRMLNKDSIRHIVQLEIEKVSQRLVEHNIKLQPNEAALEVIADEGFDPDMGARPIRRVIQKKIEDPLSDSLLAHEFKDGDIVLIGVNEDRELTLSRQSESPPEPEEMVANA